MYLTGRGKWAAGMARRPAYIARAIWPPPWLWTKPILQQIKYYSIVCCCEITGINVHVLWELKLTDLSTLKHLIGCRIFCFITKGFPPKTLLTSACQQLITAVDSLWLSRRPSTYFSATHHQHNIACIKTLMGPWLHNSLKPVRLRAKPQRGSAHPLPPFTRK